MKRSKLFPVLLLITTGVFGQKIGATINSINSEKLPEEIRVKLKREAVKNLVAFNYDNESSPKEDKDLGLMISNETHLRYVNGYIVGEITTKSFKKVPGSLASLQNVSSVQSKVKIKVLAICTPAHPIQHTCKLEEIDSYQRLYHCKGWDIIYE